MTGASSPARYSIAKPTMTDRDEDHLGRSWSMRYAVDLRQRLVDFVRNGGSKAEAARRLRPARITGSSLAAAPTSTQALAVLASWIG
jgi:hypothetical protein